MARRNVRILLADDHEIVRQGTRSLLETNEHWTICGEATTGVEAVRLAAAHKPDVVVMDVTMPEMNGLDATRAIVAQNDEIEVLILTMHESFQLLLEVLDAGARGYISKSDLGKELVSGIESLGKHRPYFSSTSRQLLSETASSDTPPLSSLSQREATLVRQLAENRTDQQLAATLNLTVEEAGTARAEVMKKLGLPSLRDLILYAVRNDLL